MLSKTPNPDQQLLAAKHETEDLFICDVADAVLKDLVPQMEHPFYSLSKKPDTQIRRYEHNGNWLEIVPSVKGLATIYDKDILIYCISQLMGKLNRNEPVGPRVHITSYDLLRFTNRGTSGKDYNALCEAILNREAKSKGIPLASSMLHQSAANTDLTVGCYGLKSSFQTGFSMRLKGRTY